MKDFKEILRSIFALFLLTCIIGFILPIPIRIFLFIYNFLQQNIF